jgi:hypothetical protein
MRERVILAVKFTPAASAGQVRKAVGGFLRYVQHRDLHPTPTATRPDPKVAGLLKYVAYRDRASARAELLGPSGTVGSPERKAFAAFVVGALENSPPQLYRGRDGELQDRRRAVYRMVISPENAQGLDLRRLTTASVAALEREPGVSGLRWIAAIHRNTPHHHVHLVLAGMCADGKDGFARVDITKPRLAAMKQALCLEIERQRSERTLSPELVQPSLPATKAQPAAASMEGPALARPTTASSATRRRPQTPERDRGLHPTSRAGSVVALRAVARRYQRQMERELEEGYRQSQWERAA